MRCFTSAEQERDSDRVFVAQESNRFFCFEADVVSSRFRAKPNFFRRRISDCLFILLAICVCGWAIINQFAFGPNQGITSGATCCHPPVMVALEIYVHTSNIGAVYPRECEMTGFPNISPVYKVF